MVFFKKFLRFTHSLMTLELFEGRLALVCFFRGLCRSVRVRIDGVAGNTMARLWWLLLLRNGNRLLNIVSVAVRAIFS